MQKFYHTNSNLTSVIHIKFIVFELNSNRKIYPEETDCSKEKSYFQEQDRENNYEDEIVQKLNNLSDFSRMQVFEKLKQMVKDKTFIDMDVRELIKKHYTIDIFGNVFSKKSNKNSIIIWFNTNNT